MHCTAFIIKGVKIFPSPAHLVVHMMRLYPGSGKGASVLGIISVWLCQAYGLQNRDQGCKVLVGPL